VPLCYAFVMVERSRRLKVLCLTVGAMTLGIGLASIYLIPAMTTQEVVPVQLLWKEKYYYGKFFLLTGLFVNSNNWGLVAYLMRIHWLVITMACLAWTAFAIGSSDADRVAGRERKFWLAIAVMSIFMMTPLSKPMWELLAPLQMIQHPWRFNTVLTVATTALVALVPLPWPRPHSAFMRTLVATTGLCLITCILMGAWIAVHTVPINKKALNRGVESLVEIVDSEYRPRWAHSTRNERGESHDRVTIVGGTGSATVLRWEPRNILLEVNTPAGVSVDVGQRYYPGWAAQVAGKSGLLRVSPSGPAGLVRVSVPSGNHEVQLRLTAGFAESTGQTISTVAALITMCLAIWLAHSERYVNRPSLAS